MNTPTCADGGCGAGTAAGVVATTAGEAATEPMADRRSIAGRLPHLAARDVHLGRPVTGFSARSGAAGGAARLSLRVHDAAGRTRLAHGPCGVRECDRGDPARDGCASDLLAHAGGDRPAGVHDR